jgi:predicted NAD-dependent protein-ADP-ribosyltransferase YbiA (DUF1768 family)
MQSDLYNNASVFQFYIKSVDKPPGKGAGEILAESEKKEYKDLQRIPDWRRKLSNLWPAAFTLDSHVWQTVDHYYQAAKYKRGHPEIYLQFSMDSGSGLAKDVALLKDGGIKYLKEHKKIDKKPAFDDDFSGTGKRGMREMEAAQYAKFSQHEDLKEVLKATKKAKLQHFERGAEPVVYYELMQVRQRVQTLPFKTTF